MSASLIFPMEKAVTFATVLQHTRATLLRLLKLQSVPPLLSKLPPRPRGSATTLEGSLIDADFPGAYVNFQGDDESTVRLGVFEGGPKELLVGVGGVSTPASDVLTAAIAVATVNLMGGSMIGDYGHHWIDRDDCTAEELVNTLALQVPQSDFMRAVELVHSKQAINERMNRG
jgi:hypothetical protein